jgi:hypothetical protein
MRTLAATPTRASRDLCPPQTRTRGLGAAARRVAVDLTPESVEQVARRVAELLHRKELQRHVQASRDPDYLTVAELAKKLGLNPAWVYEHAAELGAKRIGSGPKARIRFELHVAKAALARMEADRTAPTTTTSSRKRPRPPLAIDEHEVPLLRGRDPYALATDRRASRTVTEDRRGT